MSRTVDGPHEWPRIGVDLQDHAPVEASMDRYGHKYLAAILDESERLELGARLWDPGVLAGRFAAKEAVFKVLGAGPADAVPWPAIRVHAPHGRRPEVTLHDRARELADASGLRHVDISMTHTDSVSMACAVAISHRDLANPAARLAPRITHSFDRLITQRNLMNTSYELDPAIRSVLSSHVQFPTDEEHLERTQSLYQAGMSSHTSVSVMLGLEDEFDIEFPEAMLTKQTFSSVESIAHAVMTVLNEQAR
ncbi:acyl carrier protein [Curtobacterium sp. S6]|uniref:acyl carrier protein n=1 Tax=Curtobacterium sp. S6 TaxID=1479623 RepID=UPI0009EBDCB0|nr:acyl carrier protein [Curtobacterium sp. S6]